VRRGVWHQLGDRSQRLVREQLAAGNGVGVIVSPRDLSLGNAARYAEAYRGSGASVLCDQQFYLPEFSNAHLDSYPTSRQRVSVSDLMQIDAPQLAQLRDDLRVVSETLAVDGILAPAVLYQAGRTDLWRLNERLLTAAREVGAALGKPTYATVVLGRSATSSDQTLGPVLEQVTGLASDGWYFGFEFEPERVPSDRAAMKRCCAAILTLACTGRPVLHAFAGMMAPLSIGAGATGAAIGHSQNLWRFSPERWQPATGQGGGGDAPPRFFSRALWGTIIHPDEIAQLDAGLRGRVITPSGFSGPVTANPPQPWSRWDAHKHLLAIIGVELTRLSAMGQARLSANAVVQLLADAVAVHADIRRTTGIVLADGTSLYQDNWRAAMEDVLRDHAGNYEYLEMLG
jgi:hypothetical protein